MEFDGEEIPSLNIIKEHITCSVIKIEIKRKTFNNITLKYNFVN